MTGKADSRVKQIRRDPSHAGLSLMRFSSSMSLLCCAKIIDRSNGISLTESNTCDRGLSRGLVSAGSPFALLILSSAMNGTDSLASIQTGP